MTFEELWIKSEEISNASESDKLEIFEEIKLKLQVYEKLYDNDKLLPADQQTLKTRLFGELMYSMTRLSAKENINVFSALGTTLMSKMQ